MISLKESDIRPDELFKRYRALAEEDAKQFFGSSDRHPVDCPACGAREGVFSFEKIGFRYEVCPRCDTLYVNPRPAAASFARYYEDAPSVRFWATNFYKETETVRREMVFKPKALQVQTILKTHLAGERIACLADIGAGYGIFCEEIRTLLSPEYPIVAIEPGLALSEVCRQKGLPVVQTFLENTTPDQLPQRSGVRVATCFELIEHPHDPYRFLQAAAGLLGKGGVLILTTLNIKGFDLQILWEKSDTIHPPYHINFFSTDSIQRVFDRAGFDVLSVETPGRLDVDIVAKRLADVPNNRFLQTLLTRGEPVRQALQAFLKEHKLSSHMQIVARSRG